MSQNQVSKTQIVQRNKNIISTKLVMSISCYKLHYQVVFIKEIIDKYLIQLNSNNSELINKESKIYIIS